MGKIGEVDCAGVCRGDSVYDNCDICAVDCNGDYGGTVNFSVRV